MSKAETLLNYCKENEKDFNHDIEEMDSWSGCLGDDRIEPMYMLDEIYQNTEATEIPIRAFFGWDEDSWREEDGEIIHGKFNPNREYFYFNGYGNFVSTDELKEME